MRADFDTHRGTFLLYPTRKDVWRKDAKPIADLILNLASLISEYEPVTLGILPTIDKNQIQNSCGKSTLYTMNYNDIWIRDTGAVPCDDKFIKFGFNAWGGDDGLYKDWSDDSTVPDQISNFTKIPLDASPITLEGGNLATNGDGVLICIKNTIFTKNRNPNYSLNEIEKLLKKSLNIKKIIWIDDGLKFDETGGHIDNLCAFADKSTILLAWTDDSSNPQYEIVRRAFSILEKETTLSGEKFKIIKVPLPNYFKRTLDDCEGLEQVNGSKDRLPDEIIQPSYINFIFANEVVIIPSFDDDMDKAVYLIFENLFKNRKIIQIPSREIVLGGGGLHCISKNY